MLISLLPMYAPNIELNLFPHRLVVVISPQDPQDPPLVSVGETGVWMQDPDRKTQRLASFYQDDCGCVSFFELRFQQDDDLPREGHNRRHTWLARSWRDGVDFPTVKDGRITVVEHGPTVEDHQGYLEVHTPWVCITGLDLRYYPDHLTQEQVPQRWR